MQGLRVINVLPYRERSFILFERDQRNGFTLETRQTNMRKKKLLILGAVILTSSFGGILFINVLRGQSSSESTGATKTKPTITTHDDLLLEFKATFPIVEYSYEGISSPARRAKSAKYGKVPVIDPNLIGNKREVAFLDWEVGLPPLPINKSQVIVIGRIVEANAFLSDNKQSVYSEFKIQIENTLKNELVQTLDPGESLFAERQGGRCYIPEWIRDLALCSRTTNAYRWKAISAIS